MTTLNIIGGGRVGKTLGLLWAQTTLADVQSVLCRSQESADMAVKIVGAGTATSSWSEMKPADIHLLATPDDALVQTVRRLSESVDLSRSVVFHTSGWMSSENLSAAKENGAAVASVHPIKGFADPVTAAASFEGTRCGIEGEQAALKVLRPLFQSIGAELIEVDSAVKPLYHVATIIGCNYVVALTSLAQQSLVAAGIKPNQAMDMLIPLLRGTVNNLEKLGPTAALTGPISRGDATTVAAHLAALGAWNPRVADTYADLATHTIDIAAEQGTPAEALQRIADALKK